MLHKERKKGDAKQSECGSGFRGGAVRRFVVVFEAVLSSVVGQLSLLRGSLEHVVGPLGAAAAPASPRTSTHGEGVSAAWVHAPPATASIRPLHLSFAVTIIMLHSHRSKSISNKTCPGVHQVRAGCTYLVVLPALWGILRVPLLLRRAHWPAHVSRVPVVVIVVGIISSVPSSASHSRLQTKTSFETAAVNRPSKSVYSQCLIIQ